MKNGLFLALLALATQFSYAAPPNPCQDAGIQYLQVMGIDGWDWDDHCKRKPSEYHADWLLLVKKIKEVHLKTAAILGATVQELFGTRAPSILISLEPLGNLGSYVDAKTNDLVVGEFAEFRAAQFNQKVYAHELIHWIADQPGSILNRNLGASANHLIFRETLADWISTQVTHQKTFGLTAYTGLNVPQCMTNSRTPVHITDSASYFHFGHFLGEQIKCCESIHAFANPESSLGNYCDTIQQNSQVLENIIPTTPEWNKAFDPSVCVADHCDPHQFSSLLTPFLLKIQKLTTKNLVQELLKLAKEHPDHPRAVLAGLINSIPTANQSAFEALWKKHDPKL